MPPKFRYHVFVCQNRRAPDDPRGDCASKGSERILEIFKLGIKERRLSGIARANQAGCLDACKWGPSVVVYPEGVWYTVKTEDDAQAILEEHLVQGRIVERLLMK